MQECFRFIHAAGGFRALDVMLGDMRLFRKVGYGEHSELVHKGRSCLIPPLSSPRSDTTMIRIHEC